MTYTTNKKYIAIKDAAKDLFWKHGLKRVSIEEICQKAGASKMTFYKFFPNKTELAKTIFTDVVESGQTRFQEILKSDKPPSTKVKEILLMKLEGTNNISPEFMKDFYSGGDPELTAFVEQITVKTWENLRNDYKKAQEEGIFRKDFNIELLIKLKFKLAEVLEDENIVKLYGSPQEMILELANLLTYGIVEHEQK